MTELQVYSQLMLTMTLTVNLPVAVNPCAVSNGGCNYMCLLSPAATGDGLEPSCACPTGVSLLDDNKTCASSECIYSPNIYSIFHYIYHISDLHYICCISSVI